MEAIEIARKLAALNQRADACRAYALALHHHNNSGGDPANELEAALYLLQFDENYKTAYTVFLDLHRRGFFQNEIRAVIDEAFYAPNVKRMRSNYEKNCKLLRKYPYFFQKACIPFEHLPIKFYPYDDNSYIPYDTAKNQFGEYVNLRDKRVTRNFFYDLEHPILAENVYSEYELEYLNDNVRASETVGRENHIYLHYTDFAEFCSYLPCLNLRRMLKSRKFVFLIEDEISLYPIDFKARFGIDYSQYKPRPVGIREVNRLIWHNQLSAHNGGDFFNEVFDGHPNLLAVTSVMMYEVEELVAEVRDALKKAKNLEDFLAAAGWRESRIAAELYRLDHPTEKDIFVALYLGSRKITAKTDQYARIAPAVFFQPHFENISNRMKEDGSGRLVISSESEKIVHQNSIFGEFPYIKTFTPIRRITNSYAASVRFMYLTAKQNEAAEAANPELPKLIVGDIISERVLNRSFMVDPEDRLHKDGILVRFEDGKLNPKATFAALAAFLDLPYTESMTYCSEQGKLDPHPETKGFDTVSVYRTYDEFANNIERYFIEYFMRDAYQYYGYDFQYYDGAAVDEAKARELIAGFTTLNSYIRETCQKVTGTARIDESGGTLTDEEREQVQNHLLDEHIRELDENRLEIARLLLRGLRFVNANGQPMQMMKMLEPDPALLEREPYR